MMKCRTRSRLIGTGGMAELLQATQRTIMFIELADEEVSFYSKIVLAEAYGICLSHLSRIETTFSETHQNNIKSSRFRHWNRELKRGQTLREFLRVRR